MKLNIRKWGACSVAAILLVAGYQMLVPQREKTTPKVDTVVRTLPAPLPTPKQIPTPAPRPELERGPRHLRQVALTFDAGAEADGLNDLLRVLEREGITATFFLTGRWACENLTLARAIVAKGHFIGNHTWAHKDLTKLEDADIRLELLRTDDRFVGWFGAQYHHLARAPFGETNERVLRIMEKEGFYGVRWSIDTLDSIEPRKSAAFIEGRILGLSDANLQGAIVLMHVGYPETVQALPTVIDRLRERGFEFVPVSVWVPELGLPQSTNPMYRWPLAQP
ncbi:polysaccharide deacetylase family protein [Roseimicrobium sp. ORNL1]|uniref:polysaccharide deacetylase family protein n=1 Tax=Roseimicrobium sp. ORNL1 TaxID=2711231 RepID=UPI0013E0FB84|nr:polysaccharide deacetylase family protein [Roseimicrobium sp. ORNL1]QIF02361.1 polysaccharide deacetylase family protein [Roseimicrobium sp. ORNL1]